MEAKATLEFNLPEQEADLQMATNSFQLYWSIYEMDQWLRVQIKYQGREELQEVRDKLREIVGDNKVSQIVFD